MHREVSGEHFNTYVCSNCGHAVMAVSKEAVTRKYPTCPFCGTDQRESDRFRLERKLARENRNDVFDAFECCRRMCGTRRAVDILLDWAEAANRQRIAVDLWDAAAPGQVGAQYVKPAAGNEMYPVGRGAED